MSSANQIKQQVLFVFDEDISRKFYADLFGLFGMAVEAVNYSEALNKINIIDQYRLIITDIQLNYSVENGFGFIKAIKKRMRSRNKNVPIVIFSALSDSYKTQCLALHIDQTVLISPSIEILNGLVNQWKENFITAKAIEVH